MNTTTTPTEPRSSETERLHFKLADTMVANPEPTQCLWDPFLPKSGLAGIVGRPDSGKSMFARTLALAVAMGDAEFLGFPLATRHKTALYITTEDSRQRTFEVFRRQCMAIMAVGENGLERGKDAMLRLHFLMGDTLTPQELLETMTATLEKKPYDAVIVDSYGDAFLGKDSNSNSETRNALRPFHALAATHDCLILFVSHINKSGYNAAPDQVHAQGASAFGQKLRTILDLKTDANDPAIRYLSVTKGNAVGPEFKGKAFVLSFDTETFLYDYTGQTVPLDQIGNVSRGPVIDWKGLFGERGLQSSNIHPQTLATHAADQKTNG